MKQAKSLWLILLFFSSIHASDQDNNSPIIILKNVTILDMISDSGKKGSIFIKGQSIQKIIYENEKIYPLNAIIYDLTGKFIMPGLIDNHVHITHGSLKQSQDQLEIALLNGITGVRDMGGDGRMLALLKRNTQIGEYMGSDVFFSTIIAGNKFFINDPRPAQVALGAQAGNVSWQWAIDENTNFDEVVLQAKGIGSSAIKMYTDVNKKMMNNVSKSAKKYGLKVWAHASIAPTRPSDVTAAGVDVMSHAGDFLQYELANEIKDRYAFKSKKDAAAYKNEINNIPFSKENEKIKSLLSDMKNNNSYLDATLWIYKGRNEGSDLQRAQKATKLAYDNGVKIAAGSDNIMNQENNEINLHNELVLLVEAGLSNIDTLRAATINNAVGLGEEKKIGSIEVGKLANLIILNSDPLKKISNTRDIQYVLKRGKVYQGINSMQ
jgi:imidazolonepropionase-like amidohydrolase